MQVQLSNHTGGSRLPSPELWVKPQASGETLQQLAVCLSDTPGDDGDGDNRTWTAQWTCEPEACQDGPQHVSLHMGQAVDTLGALEGRRRPDKPLSVLDFFVDKFATPLPPKLDTLKLGSAEVEARARVLPDTHVFSETLRHYEHRSNGSGNEDSEEYSAHPLFSRWVAEDSPAFRSAIAAMEEVALANRTCYKDLSRQSTGLRDAYQSFMKQLNESLALLESMPVLDPLVSTVIQPLKRDIGQLLKGLCSQWEAIIVANARRLYESSYRHLEERKSEFDGASDHYYSELSKYLKLKASAKEDERRDEAFNRHRVAFDSARCAYFIDLWCASHGWSELE
ncbi:hypothetical protein IWW38_004968, partial [Coemansia aciculifera]